jgi:hypothetical protein
MASFTYVVAPSLPMSQTPSNIPSKMVRSLSMGTCPTDVRSMLSASLM